jgi:hypothetical protein
MQSKTLHVIGNVLLSFQGKNSSLNSVSFGQIPASRNVKLLSVKFVPPPGERGRGRLFPWIFEKFESIENRKYAIH